MPYHIAVSAIPSVSIPYNLEVPCNKAAPMRIPMPLPFLRCSIVPLIFALSFSGCGGGGGDTTGPDDPVPVVGTGSVSVTTSTSGSVLDPDGYTVVIDGAGRGAVGGNTPLTISGLAAGDHSVGLGGIAENCEVQGDNPRLVPVSSGDTVSLTFTVVCTSPAPGTGSIRVIANTSGSDPDPDGYVATLDGGAGIPVTGGSATFPDVPIGSHSVALSGIASNCSVSGPGSITTTVSAGATTEISFIIGCTALPPSVGVLRIRTTTSGQDQDADGYRFAVDGGQEQTIGVNAQIDVANTTVGEHTVVLSNVAPNCSVEGGVSRTVSVNAGQTAEVGFALTCTPAGPSASRSTVVVDPPTVVAGGATTVTVTVRDASGAPLAGVPVTLTASGEENTITPESGTSDASGVVRFSFSSTVAEHKVIAATVGGVVLTSKPQITVFLASSTTTISRIEPAETSVSGQEITVTVTVTGEGGGTPTGTVAVFSLQEANTGCDMAALSSKGVATCTFALTTVTTHTIEATYHGDDRFEESQAAGEKHVVTAASPASRPPRETGR
jgi:hypothetical protein